MQLECDIQCKSTLLSLWLLALYYYVYVCDIALIADLTNSTSMNYFAYAPHQTYTSKWKWLNLIYEYIEKSSIMPFKYCLIIFQCFVPHNAHIMQYDNEFPGSTCMNGDENNKFHNIFYDFPTFCAFKWQKFNTHVMWPKMPYWCTLFARERAYNN